MTPTEAQLDNVAEASRRAGLLDRRAKKLRKKAGKQTYDEANLELEEAIEVFTDQDRWPSLSLEDISKAGRRIAFVADKCRAILALQDMLPELEQARDDLHKLSAAARG